MFEFMVQQHIFSGGLTGDIVAAQTGLGTIWHRVRGILLEISRDVWLWSRIRETGYRPASSPVPGGAEARYPAIPEKIY